MRQAEGRDYVPKAPSCPTRHTHARLEALLEYVYGTDPTNKISQRANKAPVSTVRTISCVVVTRRDEEEGPGGRSESTIDVPECF